MYLETLARIGAVCTIRFARSNHPTFIIVSNTQANAYLISFLHPESIKRIQLLLLVVSLSEEDAYKLVKVGSTLDATTSSRQKLAICSANRIVLVRPSRSWSRSWSSLRGYQKVHMLDTNFVNRCSCPKVAKLMALKHSSS